MEQVEVVESSVDKEGHDSSRVIRFVGELVATHTLGYETRRLYEWENCGYLIYIDQSPPLKSRRRWLSHDTESPGASGYTAREVAEKAPEFGEVLGFPQKYPVLGRIETHRPSPGRRSSPQHRPGSRRGEPCRKDEGGGRADSERTFTVSEAALELGVSESYLRTLGNTGQLGVLRRNSEGQPIYSATDIKVMKKMGIGRRPRRLRFHSEAVRAVEWEQEREEHKRLKRERREEKKRLKEERREALRRERAEKRLAQEDEQPRPWWRKLFGG
jgi:DNA-binding transcriptional MerR regulator